MDKGHDKGHKGQMSDREAMKLALEALERSMEAGMTGIKVDQAITALRQALEQPSDIEAAVKKENEACAVECDKLAAVKPVSDFMHGCASGARQCAATIRARSWRYAKECEAEVKRLRQALEQEPWDTTDMAYRPSWLRDEDREILEAVRRELDRGNQDGNAPGHGHQVPGIWDSDNGARAGKPCAWCLTWKKFTTIIDREATLKDKKK